MSHTAAAQPSPVPQVRYIIERDSHGVSVRRYRQGRLLGKGGFAKCYHVTDCTTNDEYAAKIIDKQSLTKAKTKQKLLSEIKIHSTMAHPNLVQYKHCFEDDKFVYILLELCAERTLMEHSKEKKQFSEQETSFYISQCIKGLKYMHANAVIHRDLKLSNLLLDADMCIKIADFGLATQLDYDGERKRTVCGTPNYIAPEILDASQRGHSFEVDIWSLGVIMYTLLVGKPPFEMADMKSTYKRIRSVDYAFPKDLRVSPEAQALVGRILQATPEKRPNLSTILADPFFSLYPPCPLAPLTMFAYGTPRYYAQERRLQDHQAQQAREQALAYNAPYNPVGRSPLGRLDANHAAAAACGGRPVRSGSVGGYGHAQGYGSAGSARTAADWSPGYRSGSVPTSASPRPLYTRDVGNLAPPLLQGSGGGATPSPAGGYLHSHPRSSSTPYSTSPPRLAAMPAHPASASPGTPDYPHAYPSTGRSPYRSASQRRTPSASGHPQHQHPPPHQHRPPVVAPPALATPMQGGASPPDFGHALPAMPYNPASAVPHVVNPASEWEMPARGVSVSPRDDYEQPCDRAHAPGPAVEDDEERANLTTMHEVLEKTINRGTAGAAPAVDDALDGCDLEADASKQTSITCYSDFTSKYGLAYMLNNDCVGAHFNDSTKIVWNLATNQVQYVARSRAPDAQDASPAPEERLTCTPEDYPAALRKKITLITYFRTYLMRGRNTDTVDHPEVVACGKGKAQVAACDADADCVYVKRWLKTRYAIIFRLSNKSVQVSFFDGTEILLFSEARQVTYTDEVGVRSTFSLSSMLVHPKPEIAQRLKYTKEIICRLINKA